MPTILVITDKGCEQACVLEIARWMKKETTIAEQIVTVDCSLEEGALLAFHLQTARRVLLQLTAPYTDSPGEPDPAVLGLIDGTFKAEGHSTGITQELVEQVGGWVHKQGKSVDLVNPQFIVYAIKTDKTYVGLDLVGKALEKREWRIMLSRRSLRATIAAAALLYADVQGDDVLVDPSGDDGTLAIEAALLLSKTSPLQFSTGLAYEKLTVPKTVPVREIEKISVFCENLRDVKAVRMNSKLAGVEKLLHSTKVPLDWLHTKVADVDKIVTYPVSSGKALPLKIVEKRNETLFEQAAEVLKKKGTITCICVKPEEFACAQKYKFKLLHTHPVWMGKSKLEIMTWEHDV
ncbi:MAG: hypothetical protein OXR66_09185 [Candidatus Woesearchaeota archaeon]|nr:hypothetical protein [Candidatus Woesearchaeota archaeon]